MPSTLLKKQKIDPQKEPPEQIVAAELSNDIRAMIMSYFGNPSLIDSMAGSNPSKSKISGKIGDNVVRYLGLQDGVEINNTKLAVDNYISVNGLFKPFFDENGNYITSKEQRRERKHQWEIDQGIYKGNRQGSAKNNIKGYSKNLTPSDDHNLTKIERERAQNAPSRTVQTTSRQYTTSRGQQLANDLRRGNLANSIYQLNQNNLQNLVQNLALNAGIAGISNTLGNLDRQSVRSTIQTGAQQLTNESIIPILTEFSDGLTKSLVENSIKLSDLNLTKAMLQQMLESDLQNTIGNAVDTATRAQMDKSLKQAIDSAASKYVDAIGAGNGDPKLGLDILNGINPEISQNNIIPFGQKAIDEGNERAGNTSPSIGGIKDGKDSKNAPGSNFGENSGNKTDENKNNKNNNNQSTGSGGIMGGATTGSSLTDTIKDMENQPASGGIDQNQMPDDGKIQAPINPALPGGNGIPNQPTTPETETPANQPSSTPGQNPGKSPADLAKDKLMQFGMAAAKKPIIVFIVSGILFGALILLIPTMSYAGGRAIFCKDLGVYDKLEIAATRTAINLAEKRIEQEIYKDCIPKNCTPGGGSGNGVARVGDGAALIAGAGGSKCLAAGHDLIPEPEIRAVMRTIANAESSGKNPYTQIFGNLQATKAPDGRTYEEIILTEKVHPGAFDEELYLKGGAANTRFKDNTDASGRYQFISTTWGGWCEEYNAANPGKQIETYTKNGRKQTTQNDPYCDFSPINQDLIVAFVLKRAGVDKDLQGGIDKVIAKAQASTAYVACQWTSFPGCGQKNDKTDDAKAVYETFLAEEKTKSCGSALNSAPKLLTENTKNTNMLATATENAGNVLKNLNPFDNSVKTLAADKSWLGAGNGFDAEVYRTSGKFTQFDGSGGVDFFISPPGVTYEAMESNLFGPTGDVPIVGKGVPIISHLDGIVTSVTGPEVTNARGIKSYGIHIAVFYPSINPPGGGTAVFSHLNYLNPDLKAGSIIKAGTLLGRQGTSGSSSSKDGRNGSFIHVDFRIANGKQTADQLNGNTLEITNSSLAPETYTKFFDGFLDFYAANSANFKAQYEATGGSGGGGNVALGGGNTTGSGGTDANGNCICPDGSVSGGGNNVQLVSTGGGVTSGKSGLTIMKKNASGQMVPDGFGEVGCLTIAKNGKPTDPYLRALVRAIGHYEEPKSNPYGGFGGGGGSYYGRYQFAQSTWDLHCAEWKRLKDPNFTNVKCGGREETMTPVLQDASIMNFLGSTNEFLPYNNSKLPDLLQKAGTDTAQIDKVLGTDRANHPTGGYMDYNCGQWEAMCFSSRGELMIEAYKQILPWELKGKCGPGAGGSSSGGSQSSNSSIKTQQVKADIPEKDTNVFAQSIQEAGKIASLVENGVKKGLENGKNIAFGSPNVSAAESDVSNYAQIGTTGVWGQFVIPKGLDEANKKKVVIMVHDGYGTPNPSGRSGRNYGLDFYGKNVEFAKILASKDEGRGTTVFVIDLEGHTPSADIMFTDLARMKIAIDSLSTSFTDITLIGHSRGALVVAESASNPKVNTAEMHYPVPKLSVWDKGSDPQVYKKADEKGKDYYDLGNVLARTKAANNNLQTVFVVGDGDSVLKKGDANYLKNTEEALKKSGINYRVSKNTNHGYVRVEANGLSTEEQAVRQEILKGTYGSDAKGGPGNGTNNGGATTIGYNSNSNCGPCGQTGGATGNTGQLIGNFEKGNAKGLAQGGKNCRVNAMLLTIAAYEQWSGASDPYKSAFPSKELASIETHPGTVQCAGKLCSNAAGRYQYLSYRWIGKAAKYLPKENWPKTGKLAYSDEKREFLLKVEAACDRSASECNVMDSESQKFSYKDVPFDAVSQDIVTYNWITKEGGTLEADLNAGNVEGAFKAQVLLNWASSPYAKDGQPTASAGEYLKSFKVAANKIGCDISGGKTAFQKTANTFETAMEIFKRGGNINAQAAAAKPQKYKDLTEKHKAFLEKIAKTVGYPAYADAGKVDPNAEKAFDAWKVIMKTKQGTPIESVSFYRSYDEQIETFFGKINTVFDDSLEIGSPQYNAVQGEYINRAASSAPPGYSQHSTGFAVDIVSSKYPNTNSLERNIYDPELAGLLELTSKDAGFEISYPKNFTAGAKYEPWHFKFIGSKSIPAVKKIDDFKVDKPGGTPTGSGSTTASGSGTTGDGCSGSGTGSGGDFNQGGGAGGNRCRNPDEKYRTALQGPFETTPEKPDPKNIGAQLISKQNEIYCVSPYNKDRRIAEYDFAPRAHNGIDMAAESRNYDIIAMADGKLYDIGSGYGLITIQHEANQDPFGVKSESWYLHTRVVAKFAGQKGAVVKKGEVIAKMDSIGAADRIHLHFEYRPGSWGGQGRPDPAAVDPCLQIVNCPNKGAKFPAPSQGPSTGPTPKP